MDIIPQDNTTTQPISDDQELAKALAGVSLDESSNEDISSFGSPSLSSDSPLPPVAPVAQAAPVEDALPAPSMPPAPAANNDLESIKLSALKQLQPLMDKVELPADEKFDTYLMLLRSTDDASLIAPAHAAAQAISDEKRKAEALLEVIKEIDYLSRKDQPNA